MGNRDQDRERPISGAAERGRVRVESGLQALLASGLVVPLTAEDGYGLAEQLVGQLSFAITTHRLAAGTRLPSSRALADIAGVSRNVVLAAYAALTELGLVEGRHGSGSYVRSGVVQSRRARPVPQRLANLKHEAVHASAATTGLDVRLRARPAAVLPDAVWRRAWKGAAMRRIQPGYGDPFGDRRLRAALTDYLAAQRGIVAAPGDVVVTSGAADALALLVRVIVSPGETIALEEPGYPSLWSIAGDRDARVALVPVDEQGIDVGYLERLDPTPRLVHVTPAHQFPTTVEMSAPRRTQLLTWARRHDVLVVEDDYSGEFAASTAAQPTLAALDQDGVVAYVGTLSRLLAPSLRTGYLVAPRPLAVEVARHRRDIDSYLSLPVQLAVAELLTSGEMTRQLRRAHRAVANQRAILKTALSPAIPVLGTHNGLHVLIPLRSPEHEAQVTTRLRADRVIVDQLTTYCSQQPGSPGLLIDYAGLDDQALTTVIQAVRRAVGPEDIAACVGP
jgi:GntR family transcriptional regulator/MocR family aminotransferase